MYLKARPFYAAESAVSQMRNVPWGNRSSTHGMVRVEVLEGTERYTRAANQKKLATSVVALINAKAEGHR
jgi:2-keto-3-deoxy-L-rhamnonate aldolase RhmA